MRGGAERRGEDRKRENINRWRGRGHSNSENDNVTYFIKSFIVIFHCNVLLKETESRNNRNHQNIVAKQSTVCPQRKSPIYNSNHGCPTFHWLQRMPIHE